MNTLLKNGYILLSRKLLESEIWSKPPLYVKVWIYLLSRAQHQNYKGLKRGQLLTSIPEIREAMAYKVGYRVEKPTKKQIWGVLDWLRNPYEGTTKGTTDATTNEPMIVTTKVTHGILVTIVKYDLYQTSQNYEGNNEGNDEGNNEGIAKELRRERQGNNINKNAKNAKKLNNNIISSDSPIFSEQVKEIVDYLNQKVGTSYKPTTRKTRDLIKARLNEDFTVDDFKKVIDNKLADWGHEPRQGEKDMRPFLRPATLFGTKFESYLNSKPAAKATARRNNFGQRNYDDDFYKKLQKMTPAR